MGNPHRKSMEIGALNSRGPQETVDAVHHRAGKDRIIPGEMDLQHVRQYHTFMDG